jgi:hypothetical protein
MKTIFAFVIVLIVSASCGKYEKPFITFRSAEKRLTEKVWVVNKIIQPDGTELTSSETFKFSISGNDSICERTMDGVSYLGAWHWRPGLKGKVDKQKIIVDIDIPNITTKSFVYDVKVLKSKEMEFIDMNGGNTGNFKYFLSN